MMSSSRCATHYTWNGVDVIQSAISASILVQCVGFINSCWLSGCLVSHHDAASALDRQRSSDWGMHNLVSEVVRHVSGIICHLLTAHILVHVRSVIIGAQVPTSSDSRVFRIDTCRTSCYTLITTSLSSYMHLILHRPLRHLGARQINSFLLTKRSSFPRSRHNRALLIDHTILNIRHLLILQTLLNQW